MTNRENRLIPDLVTWAVSINNLQTTVGEKVLVNHKVTTNAVMYRSRSVLMI